MIPGTVLGLLLFAASLGPGYTYLRLAETREPRQERSQLVEAAELVLVGAMASAFASLLVIATAEATGLADIDRLASTPRMYIVDSPLRVLALLVAATLLANGGAALAAIAAHRGAEPTIKPGYSAWHFVLADEVGVHRKYATVEMRDGRSVAGWVAAYTVEPADPDKRELILATPLRIKAAGAESFEMMLDDGIILQGADIVAISVQTYVDRRPVPRRGWWRRLRRTDH